MKNYSKYYDYLELCDEIAYECAYEGNPPRGAIYEARTAELRENKYFKDLFEPKCDDYYSELFD